MSAAVAVTDQTFEAVVLKSSVPVLVDFWAAWCQPCRIVAPILDQIATERAGQIRVVKLDVDENPQTTAKMGITGIPALKVFKDGAVVASLVGARPKAEIEAAIDAAIN